MSRLMDGRGELGTLMRTAQMIARAQQHLRNHLPGELGDHLHVGGYRDGRLTLITDRAVWLTRLRYDQGRLLELLHQLPGFEPVTGFNFKVRPVRPIKAPLRQVRHLPARAADEIASCAADVTDPRLKSALERLAAHAERKP